MWFLFDNESGLIAQYDITFRRLEWANDYVKPFLKPQLVKELGSMVSNCDDIDDLMHLRAAIDVCQGHETYCLGALQQYNSTQACIDFIYRQRPLGKTYQWGGDTGKPYFLSLATYNTHNTTVYTAMCRYIHKGDARRLSSSFSAHFFLRHAPISSHRPLSAHRVRHYQRVWSLY